MLFSEKTLVIFSVSGDDDAQKIAYELERTRSKFSCFLNVPVKRQMNIMTFTCNILETRVRLCNDSVFMCLR